ncbi:MAG: SMC family ATPase [Armatimonadetes bacterium]|nr:SMC family ATPase [Armatimonadota bacterium]
MIPVRLWLRNFLSYGDEVPPLDLDGLHMACLSGANGHGKSALLDAITWALWGESRRDARAGGLMRLGAGEMFVELVFDQDGQRYRVRRSQRRTRDSASTTLDFFALDGESDQWRPLSMATARETQARIDARLRMGYGTFINSAFLLQGRADEFTRRSPAERKQVLGDILDLGRYERLAALAKDERRDLDRRLDRDRALVETLTAGLADAERVRADLAETVAACESAAAAIAAEDAALESLRNVIEADRRRREELRHAGLEATHAEHQLADLRERRLDAEREVQRLTERLGEEPLLQAQAARLEGLRASLAGLEALREKRRGWQEALNAHEAELRVRGAALEAEASKLTQRVAEAEARIDAVQGELAQRERLRRRVEVFRTASSRLAELDELAARRQTLLDSRAEADKAIAEARAALVTEHRGLSARQDEVRRDADRLGPATDTLSHARTALAAAQAALAETSVLRDEMQVTQSAVEQINFELTQLRVDLEEVEDHRRILDSGGGLCPLCGQDLAPERRLELLAEAESRTQTVLDRGRTQRRERERLEAALALTTQRLAARQAEADELPRCQAALTTAELAVAGARDAAAALAQLQEACAELKQRVQARAFAVEHHAALAAADAALGALDYDSAQHELVRQQVNEGRDLERQLGQLEQSEQRLAELVADHAQLAAELAHLRDTLAQGAFGQDHREAVAALRGHLDAEPWPAEQWATDSAECDRLADVPTRLATLAGAAEQRRDAEQRMGRLDEMLAEAQARLASAQERVAQLGGELVDVDQLTDERRRRVAGLEGLRAEMGRLQARRGELQALADGHLRQQAEIAETRVRMAGGEHRHAVVSALEAAFSRDGIPALVIENAVPEIEASANEILARLTDYRMSLAVRLQRATVAGTLRETLDVEIRDELGSRSYENYSGGEAFRVDFALRLALSRLLARRAGARLRTLFIDEGFGTQDEEGLEQLVEAIHAMGDEFDLVLVVTHLSALKDRFGTRIEVVKEPDTGSAFRVERLAG